MPPRYILLATLLAASPALADAPCLPKAIVGNAEDSPKSLELGLVGDAPVACVQGDYDKGGVLGCWTVDPKSGALAVAPAAALPGQSIRGKTDAKGCVDGYCLNPKAPGEVLLYATSTDGANAVVLRENTLYVFDAKTKKQVKTVLTADEKAPEGTSVGNEPIQLLYAGDAIWVVGTDAGPYITAWRFMEDGTRGGQLDGGYSVFAGGANVLDANRFVFADAGLQTLLVVNAKDGAITRKARGAKRGPCKKSDMEYLGVTDEPSKACKKHLDKNFTPFSDIKPVALPNGDLLVALSGKYSGQLAILDGKKLSEKKRLKLAVCAK